MVDLAKPGDGIIFMKVGTHAGETLDDIIERKSQELDDAGEIFWGYGGPTCHPLYHVQPFVKNRLAGGHVIYLAMEPMNSKHFAEPQLAEQYSDDGVTWHEMPKGIHVKGSRYALVLESLDRQETDIDLRALSVGIGLRTGTPANRYVRGHVDKGCFILESEPLDADAAEPRQIGLIARLKPPYAVLLK